MHRSASRSSSTARSSGRTYTWHHIIPLKFFVPASYRDEEVVRSSLIGIRLGTDSTAILLPSNAPTQCGFWACRIPAMNLLPLKLPHRRSYVVVPSTESGQPLLHFGILRSDSIPSLSVATTRTTRSRHRPCHPKIKAHIGRQNSMRISSHMSGSHIAPASNPFETRHLPSLNANRPRPLQPAYQRRSHQVLHQNVGGPAAKRDGRLMLFGVVCCERPGNNRCLRQHFYIYI